MVELKPLSAAVSRVSMLLWGDPGCGKTHFANTAPGKRLLLNFDPDGYASLDPTADTVVLDLSRESRASICEPAKSPDPYGIQLILDKDPSIKTVIVDSMTAFGTTATQYSVGKAPGATFDNPGPSGYGFRNRYVLGLVNNLLFITGRNNKHVIFICHEDVPKTDDKGNPVSITILLGGSLPKEVPSQISEVWHMSDVNQTRSVLVRKVGIRGPMKTRMFEASDKVDFICSTPAQRDKVRLDTLFDAWEKGGYAKIPLPR